MKKLILTIIWTALAISAVPAHAALAIRTLNANRSLATATRRHLGRLRRLLLSRKGNGLTGGWNLGFVEKKILSGSKGKRQSRIVLDSIR
jgi:hypothetical protein